MSFAIIIKLEKNGHIYPLAIYEKEKPFSLLVKILLHDRTNETFVFNEEDHCTRSEKFSFCLCVQV